MDLSVIIVNHNTKKLCTQTVDAVIATTHKISYEIIVTDNSTKAGEVFAYNDERVHIYTNIANNGFGNACNIGAKKAKGKYILFLNSDTVMQEGTLDKCVEYMRSHIEVGCLGIKTLLADGKFDHGCKRGFPTPFNSLCYCLKLHRLFPKSRLFGGYTLSYLSPDETHEVDSVSGAFMLIPKSTLDTVGLFDEQIFMYAEDIDLCYRIKQAGYKVIYYSDVYMLHLKGQSGLHTKNTAVIRYFRDGITIFYDKYYKEKYPAPVTFLMHLAINTKFVLDLVRAKQSK